MFKNIIAPIQAWLMSQGKCVGCGKELPKLQGRGLVRTTCVCDRAYMYDPEVGKFRRATIEEAR